MECMGDEALGIHTNQLEKDYKQNECKEITYLWNEEKQEWQNQLSSVLKKQGKDNVENLLNTKEEKSIIL